MVDPTLKRIFQLDTVADPAASISDARIELEMKIGPNGTFKNIQLTWEQFLALVAGTASAPTAEQVFNLFQTGTGVDLRLQDGDIFLNLRQQGEVSAPRPSAPTDPRVDDRADTFSVLPVGEFDSFTDYVYFTPDSDGIKSLASAGYQLGNRIALGGLSGSYPPNSVGLAVAGSPTRPQGKFCTNPEAFTVASSTPATASGTFDPYEVPLLVRQAVVDGFAAQDAAGNDSPFLSEPQPNGSLVGMDFDDPENNYSYRFGPVAFADGCFNVWRSFLLSR
jgi:hypothetical protein